MIVDRLPISDSRAAAPATAGLVTRTQPDGAGSIPIIAESLRVRREWMRQRTSDSILAVLDDYSQRLGKASAAASVEGLGFLVFWLKSRNLDALLHRSLPGGRSSIDGFWQDRSVSLRCQPAGLICHWVAGNVPTLPVFSWVLALITKNVSIVRISESSIEPLNILLDTFRNASGGDLSGDALLQTVRFIHYDKSDEAQHEQLSRCADCKVVWGGEDAVESITALSRRHHCTELVFGPKYSIGVIGREALRSPQRLERVADALARDTFVFDQRACSSPQTVFFEKGNLGPREVLESFARAFERLDCTRPKTQIDTYTATRIYDTRATWGLTAGRDFRASRGSQWTVCLDSELALKEAVQSRTLFLTAVDDIEQILPLMSPRIQTIAVAIEPQERALRFADACTARGIARCVRPGLMHGYDLPWDGRMVLSDLVRCVSVKL